MNLYNKTLEGGELWFRDTEGNRVPATIALSAVYMKYATAYPTFYNHLSTNNVTRFDVFYDTIFVETPAGYFFEKLNLDDRGITPFSLYNFYTPIIPKRQNYAGFSTRCCYWLQEDENKIYYAYVAPMDENKNSISRFSFTIHLNVFDTNLATVQTVLFDRVRLIMRPEGTSNWSNFNVTLEDPVITFNETTRLFNISFLLKNEILEFGIMSFNISPGNAGKQDQFHITEVSLHLPYMDLDEENCAVFPYDPFTPLPYHILTVATDKTDPAYNLRYIKADVTKFGDSKHVYQKYLVLE